MSVGKPPPKRPAYLDPPPIQVSEELLGALEALIFAAGDPATVDVLTEALDIDKAEVTEGLRKLSERYTSSEHGIELAEVDGGWQFRTHPRFSSIVLKLRGGRPQKLSRPALEVLAVIAYRQPATRHEIEGVRGVDSGGVLKTLLEKNLVRVSGRREEPGRPLEYATTPEFLRMFQLPSIGALPTLREREELLRDLDRKSAEVDPGMILAGLDAQTVFLPVDADNSTIKP